MNGMLRTKGVAMRRAQSTSITLETMSNESNDLAMDPQEGSTQNASGRRSSFH